MSNSVVLTNKIDSAIAIICRIATSEKLLKTSDLAQAAGISVSHVEAILVDTRRAGITRGQRGPGGGYRLVRSPQNILVSEIVLAFESPQTESAFQSVNQVRERILASLSEISIADLSGIKPAPKRFNVSSESKAISGMFPVRGSA